MVEHSTVNRVVVSSSLTRGANGRMVKRLRHRPFTAVSGVRFPHGSPTYGRLAQLGERLPYKQDVGSSILSSSTICGNSSAVEHRLAKAGVASSNLVSRSNFIWRHSQAVRQRSAKPLFPSSILGAASTIVTHAGVAEQADATDLKSVGWKQPYRFDSGPRHHQLYQYLSFSYYAVVAEWQTR